MSKKNILGVRQQLTIAISGLTLSLLVGGGCIIKNNYDSAQANNRYLNIQQLQILSQSVAARGQKASRSADNEAFSALSLAVDDFNGRMKSLTSGGEDVAAADEDFLNLLSRVGSKWAPMTANVDTVGQARKELSSISSNTFRIQRETEHMSKLATFLGSSYEANPDERYELQLIQTTLQGISSDVFSAISNEKADMEIPVRVLLSLGKLSDISYNFTHGNESQGIRPITSTVALSTLKDFKDFFEKTYDPLVRRVANDMIKVQSARQAGFEFAGLSESLLSSLKEAGKYLDEERDDAKVWMYAGVLFGLLGLAFAAMGGVVVLRDSKRNESKMIEETNNQQRAIMLLLDEISGLAEGDLTVTASTNNGVTVAVAEAVNYAVHELNMLIGRVRSTIEKVSSSTHKTAEISELVKGESLRQTELIISASSEVAEISSRIDDVAMKTSIAADAATDAVSVSEEGGRIVQETILGMNAIRDTIQETAKRIKQVGESSQEIGEVTSLIKDVGSQIHILALNAAIQAADAGEAGRGFEVVAQEVQRLAEYAGDAAKKIEGLVDAIQASAKEAVSAMEISTARVVDGARTADKAGDALKRIGEASASLATSINEVTDGLQAESEKATDVALGMNEIKEYTEKSMQHITDSEAAIGEVNVVVGELEAVANNFKV